MNLDLKATYERGMELAKAHTPISIGVLKHLASLVMRRTGGEVNALVVRLTHQEVTYAL